MNENFWWAEFDSAGAFEGNWVPTLQTDSLCLTLPIGFQTKQECIEFIKTHILEAAYGD